MTKDEQITQLTAERDALIEEVEASRLLLSRQKNRHREVIALRETIKHLRAKVALLSAEK